MYKEALLKAKNAQIDADKLDGELSVVKMQKREKEAQLEAKYGEDWMNEAVRRCDTLLTGWQT